MKRTVHNELRSVSHLIYRFVENLPGKKRLESMTGTNGCIIGYLAEHNETDVFQKDIEKAFGITRSTASKILNLMEQKELVERHSVPYDARLKKIILTEKSRAVAHLMSEDMAHVEAVLTDGFSEGELENLYSYIGRIKDNLQNHISIEKEDKLNEYDKKTS